MTKSVELRRQDDHLAAESADGLPRVLDEAAEQQDPEPDIVRFVLHRGADRLTVGVEPGHDPERPSERRNADSSRR